MPEGKVHKYRIFYQTKFAKGDTVLNASSRDNAEAAFLKKLPFAQITYIGKET